MIPYSTLSYSIFVRIVNYSKLIIYKQTKHMTKKLHIMKNDKLASAFKFIIFQDEG